ncbi:hypothetical protein EON65_56880 [archaeon]|nr:MAG: hypothetical protein EON65_56880 [archaeon]
MIYPYPIPPPTGAELMSTPIQAGAVSRKDKEVYYVVRNINQRLNALHKDLTFNTYKVKVFTVCLVFAMIGILLILIGTATSVLFAEQKVDLVKIVFGALFCIPMLVWIKFMYAPDKNEKHRRLSLRAERGESKHKNLYDRIADQARKYAEPPPRRIKVIANLRKKDHAIIAGTWKEFCEELEHQSGVNPCSLHLTIFHTATNLMHI